MALTWPVTLAVLFAALLHAAWNVMVKRSDDAAADLATLTLGASLLAAPLLVVVAPPAPAAWPFLFASNVIHVGYYATLVATYRHADLGIGYPMMRGSAPLLVALFGAIALAEVPSAGMWAGIALISVGVASLAFAHGWRRGAGRATMFALANATMIAAYTLVDAAGARSSGNVLGYVLWMFFLEGLPFAAFMLWRRGRAYAAHVRSRWRGGLAGGAFSALSYGIAVWAMTVAPVGAVSALRETSVVFALGLGALLLNERLNARRWVGVAAVLAGAVVLRA
jgi:drug/metabolite transporter (DMT)-like permease